MSASPHGELRRRWFPLCGLDDLPDRHIFETELLGQELAVWRGIHGNINVWANRCPHRGMRFTVGANLGTELRCAYHGYRFEDGSGRCKSVPSQPDKTAPQSLCATRFPAHERHGLIWSSLEPQTAAPEPLPCTAGRATALYAAAVNAPAVEVAAMISRYRFRPSAALRDREHAGEHCSTKKLDDFAFESLATKQHMTSTTMLLLQPVSALSTVIHARLMEELDGELRALALRHHAEQLTELRSAIESAS